MKHKHLSIHFFALSLFICGMACSAPANTSETKEDTITFSETENIGIPRDSSTIILPETEATSPKMETENIAPKNLKEVPRSLPKPIEEKENIEEVEIEQRESATPIEEEKKRELSDASKPVIREENQEAESFAPPSHSVWGQLLKKYVSSSGKVNYKGFKAEKTKLEQYVSLLSANAPQSSWSKNERLAYWINVYNAFTVKLIVDNYPLKSIMDIDGGKAWDRKFVKIGANTYSLNDVEHTIIRKRFNEPRIHFAVNCAAKSCPPLLNEAYLPSKLSSQLQTQTVSFINNSSLNALSATKAEVSSLFDWYKVDFTKNGSVADYINTYARTKINPNAQISFMTYNWALNE